MDATLIYVHDPMCSWCWGFEPTRRKFFAAVAERLPIRRLVGGLAPDSDVPMAEEMRSMLQQTWQRIQQTIPGTEFNFDFWQVCTPRRSTYPANRAVLAARQQGEDYDPAMTHRIQQAYYLEARNPSDNDTLIELAKDIGLDSEQFASDLVSENIESQLVNEIQTSRSLGINGFPSLALIRGQQLHHLALNYTDTDAMLTQVEALTG